ncbi:hypothetical protein E3P99_01995 [Wallemia hederae]|uniref:Uncharacterized protein n=1 Tax=Wallemia hederae TaxID=1540922 RepID=A0A4T0FLS9_9BASI|nr:hypothetical protein E3P99_01995 [Wallemia hederae]
MALGEINPSMSDLGEMEQQQQHTAQEEAGGVHRTVRGRTLRRNARNVKDEGAEVGGGGGGVVVAASTNEQTKSSQYPVCQCEHCDKAYSGKHARSILRRHYQEKHGIPLTAQPRRTRWDNTLDRPKDDEDRRRRMLESKRRWAANKRRKCKEQEEQDADGSGSVSGGASMSMSMRSASVVTNDREGDSHAQVDDTDDPIPTSKLSRQDTTTTTTSTYSVTPVRPKSNTSASSSSTRASTLPPLTYPTRAPPSIPRFEIFKEEQTPFKLPALTPFRPTNTFFSDTPPPTLFRERSRLDSNVKNSASLSYNDNLSSPAHPDLATKLGLAPTPKHLMFSPGASAFNDSPVKVRSKLPSLSELTGDAANKQNSADTPNDTSTTTARKRRA